MRKPFGNGAQAMMRSACLVLAMITGGWLSALPAAGSGHPLGVVTSVIPLGYIVEELGGARVKVDILVPPGASPHMFEPVPSDIRKLARARLFVAVGGDFDGWSARMVKAAAESIEVVHVMEAPGLNPLEGEDHHDHGEEQMAKKDDHDHHEEKSAKKDDHGHGHGEERMAKKDDHGHDHAEEKSAKKDDHGHGHGEERMAKKDDHGHGHAEEKSAKKDDHGHGHGEERMAKKDDHGHDEEEFDPHFWLDPLRVRDAVVPMLTARLVAADPAGKATYEKRQQDFQQRLTALDERIRAEFAEVKSRKYIAFHAAWPYFAERYDLDRVAVVQEFVGEEPTPREVAALVRDARAAGVGAVMVEPQLNPRVAQTIAAEFGASTVVVDPLGDTADPARDSYEDLIQFNASAFREAMERNRN